VSASGLPLRPRRRLGGGSAWYFVLPGLAIYLFVVVWPSIQGVGISFTDWGGLAPAVFTGLQNYANLFSDPQAGGAILHTLLIAAVVTVVQVGLGLLIALGVNSNIKSRNVLRVFFFAPAIVLPVAVAYLWQYILGPRGALNALLESVGLAGWKHDWLGDSHYAIWSVIVVIVWQFTGYSMVIFLANLQSIPEDIIEASHLDGTGAFTRFWYVVRPLLGPSLTLTIMLALTNALKLFDQVWILTQGGPAGATDTMSTLIYRDAFQFGQFGYGTTLAVVLAVVVVAISTLQFRGLRSTRG
jgi:raffinose/stachyose/melibiose transport system permease protein